MSIETEVFLVFLAAGAVLFIAGAIGDRRHGMGAPHPYGHLTEQREEDPRK